MIEAIRRHLIDDIRHFFNFWSTRFDLLAIALGAWLEVYPDAAVNLWATMPNEVRAMIPPEWASKIVLTLTVLSFVSRAIKQRKLVKAIQNGTETTN